MSESRFCCVLSGFSRSGAFRAGPDPPCVKNSDNVGIFDAVDGDCTGTRDATFTSPFGDSFGSVVVAGAAGVFAFVSAIFSSKDLPDGAGAYAMAITAFGALAACPFVEKRTPQKPGAASVNSSSTQPISLL